MELFGFVFWSHVTQDIFSLLLCLFVGSDIHRLKEESKSLMPQQEIQTGTPREMKNVKCSFTSCKSAGMHVF